MNEKFNIKRYVNNGIEIDVKVDYENKTIWLNRLDLAILCEKKYDTMRKIISRIVEKYIYIDKLEKDILSPIVCKMATTKISDKSQNVEYFNYDFIKKY